MKALHLRGFFSCGKRGLSLPGGRAEKGAGIGLMRPPEKGAGIGLMRPPEKGAGIGPDAAGKQQKTE